jgi:hypothetical protein
MYKSNTAEPILQSSEEILVRQIPFDPRLFPALTVEENHGWRPHYCKTMKPSWMFFDVRLYGQEIVIDEVGSRSFFIRLGVQPSASPSRG